MIRLYSVVEMVRTPSLQFIEPTCHFWKSSDNPLSLQTPAKKVAKWKPSKGLVD
ncbi:MAG: hypothetical protein MJZ14_02205 [Paludibacteraceae bacterium]|nr:hypothetical protein [Paludibacteraceae bacterium]